MRFFLILFSSLFLFTSCIVKSKCSSNNECSDGKICNENGECVYQCVGDNDCEGLYVCKNHKCELPSGCKQCFFPNAEVECGEDFCKMGKCKENFYDINGNTKDGCEYFCIKSNGGIELCDYKDNDCDGKTDEDFDLTNDVENCGECGVVCKEYPNSSPLCVNGECTIKCDDGYFNNNGKIEDGCESQECIVTNNGVEICDMIDNDCDGLTDEGFSKDLPSSCGNFCEDCTEKFPHAKGDCKNGKCVMGECENGFFDANQSSDDGCECEITNNGVEICDNIDNDCDGLTDEDLLCCPPDMVGIVPPEGACDLGNLKPFCIDKYEASVWENPDCTGKSFGTSSNSFSCDAIDDYPDGFPPDVGDGGGKEEVKLYACSKKGVYPSRCISYYQAKKACENSGKRLCTPEEWQIACMGSGCYEYPYGNEFSWDICNYIDTFGEKGKIDQFFVTKTGEMGGCKSDFGVYDLSGNVWELNSSMDGYVKGGAFNCNFNLAPKLEKCSNSTFFGDLLDENGKGVGKRNNVGFRCCL